MVSTARLMCLLILNRDSKVSPRIVAHFSNPVKHLDSTHKLEQSCQIESKELDHVS